MKKVLIGLALVSSLAMAGEQTNLYLKAGVDIDSKFDVMKGPNDIKLNSKKNDKQGYEFAVEVTQNLTKDFEAGFGIAYQEHGEPKSVISQGFEVKSYGYQSVPLYVTGKYNFSVESDIKPYLKADIGYSFNFGEKDIIAKDIETKANHRAKASIDNGVYYGLGAGVEYHSFIAELMYKVNTADMKLSNENIERNESFDYSRVTFSIGYKF